MRHAACVWLAATRGHCVKAIILVGISALALGACTSMPAAAPSPSPATVLTVPAQYRILSAEEATAGMPTLADSADAKAYVGAFLNWVLEPGHLINRSAQLMTGSPPDMPEGVDFFAIVDTLAQEGHPGALLMVNSGEPEGLEKLAASGNPTAQLAVHMTNIAGGSLQQKMDALTWFRAQAPTNRDAAFVLGSTLLSQTGAGDVMSLGIGGAATPGEVREGAALLLKAAEAAPLDIMLQIATLMGSHPGVDADVDGQARRILELVVAETDATPIPQPSFGDVPEDDDMDEYLEYEAKLGALGAAVEARIMLAGMLAKGHGGPADTERAIAYYRNALEATQDYRAYEALIDLGVNVGEYDDMFGPPPGDDWWDFDPEAPADDEWEEEPEVAPEAAPAPPPH